MINKFYVFTKLLRVATDICDITDADMNNYADRIEIRGEDKDGSTIKIEVSIENKEAQNEAVS